MARIKIEADSTWERWEAGDREARAELITMYHPLVERVAGKMWKKTPPQVELDDLISYGSMGLIRAVENYDRSQKVAFETYAIASIRGVILDELRSLDWAPRSLRRKQRRVDQAVEKLEFELEREPTPEEVATCAEMTVGEVVSIRQATESAKHRSLDERSDATQTNRYDSLPDTSEPTPEAHTMRRSVFTTLARGVVSLSLQEQLVLALYYYEGLTLADVARVVGIPESRASDIHTRTMMAMRATMGELLTA